MIGNTIEGIFAYDQSVTALNFKHYPFYGLGTVLRIVVLLIVTEFNAVTDIGIYWPGDSVPVIGGIVGVVCVVCVMGIDVLLTVFHDISVLGEHITDNIEHYITYQCKNCNEDNNGESYRQGFFTTGGFLFLYVLS